MLAVVPFYFPNLVDIHEVVEGLPGNTNDTDMVLLMARLEEVVDAVLGIAPLDAVLCDPSRDHEG
jgi:hypothetical protein